MLLLGLCIGTVFGVILGCLIVAPTLHERAQRRREWRDAEQFRAWNEVMNAGFVFGDAIEAFRAHALSGFERAVLARYDLWSDWQWEG